MTFERTNDLDLVREIMTHPRVYPYITDDFSPAPQEFVPVEHPSIWYMLARDGEDLLGLWMFVPHSHVCWEVHTCLLPAAYGARASRAAREMADWIFGHTTCQRIITNVPALNRLALRFAERAGMTRFGVNERSFLKGGMLLDQFLLGLSKCQQH